MVDDRLACKFRRAARQRLVAVELLVEHGLHFEAVYLAGYVVECGLKSLIIRRTPDTQKSTLVMMSFRGRRGHDFEYLRWLLRQTRYNLPEEIIEYFLRVSSWDTALRYEPGIVPKSAALLFVSSAVEILNWTERS